MRPPAFAYPRAAMQARVIARLEAGMSMTALEKEPGYPSRQTLHRWGRADPAFARQVAAARAWSRDERGYAKAGPVFEDARAEAFLLQIRRGETMADLMARPEWPNRALLDRWKRERPDFAQALIASLRFARDFRGPRRPFDQAIADQVIVRVARGVAVKDLAKDKAMPGRKVLARWRKRHPDFAAALHAACRAGHRHRMAARSKCTPKLTRAIARHIENGGSLLSAARRVPGAPHPLTLHAWDHSRRDFAEAIEWARRCRDEQMADQVLMIAEDATPQTYAADKTRLHQLRLRYATLQPRRKADG